MIEATQQEKEDIILLMKLISDLMITLHFTRYQSMTALMNLLSESCAIAPTDEKFFRIRSLVHRILDEMMDVHRAEWLKMREQEQSKKEQSK